MAAALGLEGALPALKSLSVAYQLTHNGLSNLARALTGGTSPQLQDLSIGSFGKAYDMVSIADMLEARASILGCARFEDLSVNNYRWFGGASLETQIRLLRVLLPSIWNLSRLSWKRGFGDCFCEVKAPFITELELSADEGNISDFSWKVLEAVPALESIDICGGGTSFLKPVSTALRHGALQNLVNFTLEQYVRVEVGDIWEFADALEHSVCATQLESLHFRSCQLMEEMVRAVAGPLSRGAFPALTDLTFSDDDIRDEGTVILAKALLNAKQTCLQSLNLSKVGMGDAAVAALVSVVQQGRFDELYELSISETDNITDEGMTALAGAIEARGLPRLTSFTFSFENVTAIGISAIVDALLKGCPKLRTIWLANSDSYDDYRRMITAMVQAAGRDTNVYRQW